MEKDSQQLIDTNRSIQGKTQNLEIKLNLLENKMSISICNLTNMTAFQGVYSFEDFSELLRITYRTLEDIFELIEGIIISEINQISIGAQGQITIQYGVYNYKLKRIQLKYEILATKALQKTLNIENFQNQIKNIKNDTTYLKQDLTYIQSRLERVQKILDIKLKEKIDKVTREKQKNQLIFYQNQEQSGLNYFQLNKKIDENEVKFKFQNDTLKVEIQNQYGDIFEADIKNNDIPQQLALLYPCVKDFYKQVNYFYNKQDKQKSDKKFMFDKHFNLIFQLQIERAGQKLKQRRIFRTNKVKQNKLQLLQKQLKLLSKQYKKQNFNKEAEFQLNLNQLKIFQEKQKEEFINWRDQFTQRLNVFQSQSVQKKNQQQVIKSDKAIQQKLNQLNKLQQKDRQQLQSLYSNINQRIDKLEFKISSQKYEEYIFQIQQQMKNELAKLKQVQENDQEKLTCLNNIITINGERLQQAKLASKNLEEIIGNVFKKIQCKLTQCQNIYQKHQQQIVKLNNNCSDKIKEMQTVVASKNYDQMIIDSGKILWCKLIDELKRTRQKDKKDYVTLSGFSQKLIQIEDKFKIFQTKIKRNLKESYSKYFDTTHPNFDLSFELINDKTIEFINKQCTYQSITSPVAISEMFKSYSYKVINSSSNEIIFGLGSQQLRNNKKNLYTNGNNFIGYNGFKKGSIFDQYQKGQQINKGGIRIGDVIRIDVDVKQLIVTWYKNELYLHKTQISKKMAQKKLYPALFMCSYGDIVEINY